MDNNDNKPYVQEYPAIELLSEKARESLSQDLGGTPIEVAGTMRESFVRTPEEAASRAAERLRAMFAGREELADSRDKEANEYMGTMGSITARSRQLTAQQLDNCVKDKDNNPLVCYGCRNSLRSVGFPGTATPHGECAACTRYVFARTKDEEQLKRIDRYIADDILEEIYKEWRKTQIDDIKKNVRQEVMDEMAKEAQVMSPNKINRIILRKQQYRRE